MNVRLATLSVSLTLLLAIQAAFAQQRTPPPPAPGDAPPAAEGRSPSDQPPTLNARTTRGYAPGQAPGKGHVQGPVQGPMQAPEKQAPAPAQAPSKGATYQSGQPHVVGYAPACANCQVTTAAPATTTNYQRTANSNYRRGIFRRGYR
jgi:hypothetical protein